MKIKRFDTFSINEKKDSKPSAEYKKEIKKEVKSEVKKEVPKEVKKEVKKTSKFDDFKEKDKKSEDSGKNPHKFGTKEFFKWQKDNKGKKTSVAKDDDKKDSKDSDDKDDKKSGDKVLKFGSPEWRAKFTGKKKKK